MQEGQNSSGTIPVEGQNFPKLILPKFPKTEVLQTFSRHFIETFRGCLKISQTELSTIALYDKCMGSFVSQL